MPSSPPDFDTLVALLDGSTAHLAELVRPLDDDQITAQAYPTEWTIAQVLSHLGSGAVIMGRRFDDALTDEPTPDEFAPSVWDEWNNKAPRAMVDDGLAADATLVARLASLTDDQRSSVQISMGPMQLDAAGFVALRVNEHAVHTWDVEVALDPAATVSADATAVVVDSLAMLAGFTGKPSGRDATIDIATTAPERAFRLRLTPESVALEPADATDDPDLVLPADALIRLVYGRLDPDHTPAVTGDADLLDELRTVFPGF